MSIEHPNTLEEWDAYFARYSGRQLQAKARAMNTMKFVKALRAEGCPMGDVEKIFTFMARRLKAAEYPPPPGGVFDLRELVQDDPETVPGNFNQPHRDYDDSHEKDEVDQFLSEADSIKE
jgi:hypothetical protein